MHNEEKIHEYIVKETKKILLQIYLLRTIRILWGSEEEFGKDELSSSP